MKANKILISLFMLLSSPVMADDAKPAEKPTCGTTINECQKKFDLLNTEIGALRLQRDIIASALADLQLQTFLEHGGK
jgi:hypothetical protein